MLLNTRYPPTRYGRLYAPDPRDMRFPLRASAFRAAFRLERHWRTGPTLDQGPYPHCVGYTVHQFLLSAPFMMRAGRTIPSPIEIYRGAQRNDEWAGESYDGTSGRGALKWLRSQRYIDEFHMPPDPTNFKNALLTMTPLMCGTEWYAGLSQPKFIGPKSGKQSAWIEPTGTYEGGHETLWVGYSRKRDAYRILNSWGESYGEGGRVWIDRQIGDHLIYGMNGDAYSAIEIK